MKLDHLSLPHPVLNLRDDVSGEYEITHSVQKNRDEIVISVSHQLLQNSLESLILRHEACFLTEVHCPQTLFRVAYTSHEPDQTIIIPATNLRDFVEVSFFVIASQTISPYVNKEANQDYEGYMIEVSRGDVLAYGGREHFFAEKKWEAQKSVANFMEIRPYGNLDGPMKFFLGEQKIIVQLPAGDYKSYRKLVGYDQFAPIFHSAIVLPALMFAISEMISNAEQYEDFSWYKVIDARRNADEKIKNLPWELENVPEIAQMILNNPAERSLWAMWGIVDQFISANNDD